MTRGSAAQDVPWFGDDFVWGAATAAYQIEGAVAEDGRGPSVWDTFCRTPGRVRDGDTGDVACDHYHRWREDVDLLAGLGLTGYRFSVAWPRVLPTGAGSVNDAGLAFYDRLVDALLEKGIEPLPTLFHWDLPQALEDAGGWLSRDTAARFADYAAVVAARLGDRVTRWVTLNEPFVVMALGYAFGVHAPGHALLLDALPAGHHQLLAHGLAAEALRANASRSPQVLLTNNLTPVQPASAAPQDVAAAAVYDALHNRFFTDPLLLGRYPDLSAVGLPEVPPYVRDGDLATIAGHGVHLDGLGVNYYNPTRVAAAPDAPLPFAVVPVEAPSRTGFDWPVVPDGLHDLLLQLKRRYGQALPPVHVTENGCSYPDEPGPDGVVHDTERIAFLDGHLRALHRAVADGVDVRSYYVWSLLDNFEWAEGYSQRFGLVHVDLATGERTPKESYAWFRDLVAAQRGRPA